MLATSLKFISIRSNNAADIHEKLDNWSKQGIRRKKTILYEGSHQNRLAERKIQHFKAGIRSSLKDAGLPLEF